MRKGFFIILFSLSIIYNCGAEIQSDTGVLDQYRKKYNYKVAEIDYGKSEKDLYKLGLQYLNHKFDHISAEKIFRYLATKYPKNLEYQYYESKSAFFIGEKNYYPNVRIPYDISLTYIKKLTEAQPNNPKYLLMMSYAIGRVGLFIRDREGGLAGITELMDSKTYIDKILENVNRGETVLNKVDAAVKKGPVFVDAILTRAEVYHDSPGMLGGDKDMGVKIYKKVIEKLPNNMRAHVLYGKHLQDTENKHKEAIKEFTLAEKAYDDGHAPNDPSSDQMYGFIPRNRCKSYWKLGKYEKAYEQIKIHKKRRPTSGSAYSWLAVYYNHFGHKEKALKNAKKAVFYNELDEGAKNMIERLSKK